MDKDILKFILQRYDGYYNSVNTKGNYLLGFSTFLCGAIFASYKGLVTILGPQSLRSIHALNILIIILLVLCLVSIMLICFAIIPYLRSGNSSKDKYHSLLYFGSVSEFKEEEYASKIKGCSDIEFLEDMGKQICVLAKGLKKKYNLLFWAGWLVPLKVLIILSILIIVISG